MSRLHLTQQEIDTLDIDTLYELLQELNTELVTLAGVEHMIYKRRRFLELESNPNLLTLSPSEDTSASLLALVKELKSSGVDIQALLNSSLNE